MNTRYSVLQYLPNPLTGERINFGVVVFDGERVRARFLQRWERVSRFSGRDITFLRRFAERIEKSIEQGGEAPGTPINAEQLEKIAGRFTRSIQLTPPRPSNQPIDAVIEEVSSLFLIEAKPRAQRFRGRDVAARLAAEAVRAAVQQYLPDRANEYFHRNSVLVGELEPHALDAVVANGQTILGAQGLSFENPDERVVAREVSAVAFTMRDIRDQHGRLPLGVVTLIPDGGLPTKELQRAQHLFKELQVEVLRPDETQDWAGNVMRSAVRAGGGRI